MKIVVNERPKTSQECSFSKVLANGNLACILDNENYCNFICENTMKCPCLITFDEINNKSIN